MKMRLGVMGPEVDAGVGTVALIGAAPTALAFPFDAEEYDYVVRMNYALPLSEEIIEATGPATDVLYTFGDSLAKTPIEVLSRLSYIRLHPDVEKTIPLELRDRTSHVDRHLFEELCRKISGGDRSNRPNMGIMAMADLIESGWKVYATGFSFFQSVIVGNREPSVHYAGYVSPYTEVMNETQGNYKSHQQPGQIDYFRKELAPKLLGMDPVMESIWHNKEQ